MGLFDGPEDYIFPGASQATKFGLSLFDNGGGGGGGIDINAEMARINALYEQARTQGSDVITKDFQAQRGELAQSQAARGTYRSGVSQLGLARLGAARQQALGSFNAQLSATQAGQSSSLLNALLGRKSALDESAADRKRQGQSQLLGLGAGLLGSYLGGPIGGMAAQRVASGGFNFSPTNYVAPGSGSQFFSPPQPQFYMGENTTLGSGGGTTFASARSFR